MHQWLALTTAVESPRDPELAAARHRALVLEIKNRLLLGSAPTVMSKGLFIAIITGG